MHLSIHTKELDNGWILDAEISGVRSPLEKGKPSIHEIYGSWDEVKERIMKLLEEVIGQLKEGIPEGMK